MGHVSKFRQVVFLEQGQKTPQNSPKRHGITTTTSTIIKPNNCVVQSNELHKCQVAEESTSPKDEWILKQTWHEWSSLLWTTQLFGFIYIPQLTLGCLFYPYKPEVHRSTFLHGLLTDCWHWLWCHNGHCVTMAIVCDVIMTKSVWLRARLVDSWHIFCHLTFLTDFNHKLIHTEGVDVKQKHCMDTWGYSVAEYSEE